MSNKTRIGPYAASKLIVNGVQIFDAPMLAIVGPREDEITVESHGLFGVVPPAPADAVVIYSQNVTIPVPLPASIFIARQSVLVLVEP